jgi:dCTP diphosphatase
MRNIDLVKLNREIEAFVADRDWDQFHSVKNLAMALTVEASELQEIFQWMREEDSNRVAADDKLRARVSDELADVFVYLLRIAAKTGVDLETAVRTKMEKNADKYPVELARGNSRKYDEL